MTPTLYRGPWPQNVSRLAKYAVRFENGEWKVTVFYDLGQGLTYLAVEGAGDDVVARVNAVKRLVQNQDGGAFYVNEYRHIIVPVASDGTTGPGAHYYFAGTLATDFGFVFEGKPLSTKPVGASGGALKPGDKWIGPRPGIPYVLSAGGGDIHYETPALEGDPPAVRPNTVQKVKLSKVIGDAKLLSKAVAPIVAIKGHQGGRFYVNEHGALFAPVGTGDGDGIDYVYCGQIDRSAWFPEPKL